MFSQLWSPVQKLKKYIQYARDTKHTKHTKWNTQNKVHMIHKQDKIDFDKKLKTTLTAFNATLKHVKHSS